MLDRRIEAIVMTGTRLGDLRLRPATVEAIADNQERATALLDATELVLEVFPGSRFVGLRRGRGEPGGA